MKKLFLTSLISLLLSTSAFAADKEVELGLYNAVDVESGEIHASLLLRADKTVNFKVATPDFEMPEPGCEGKWVVRGNMITSDLKCPLIFLPEVHVEIDITTVTPESVRSEEGALVPVSIDVLGSDAAMYRLKKIN